MTDDLDLLADALGADVISIERAAELRLRVRESARSQLYTTDGMAPGVLVNVEARIDATWAPHLAEQSRLHRGELPTHLELFYETPVDFLADAIEAGPLELGAAATALEGAWRPGDGPFPVPAPWYLRSWVIGGEEQIMGGAIPFAVLGLDQPIHLARHRPDMAPALLVLVPEQAGVFAPVRVLISGTAYVAKPEPPLERCRGNHGLCGREVPLQVTPAIPLCRACFLRGVSYAPPARPPSPLEGPEKLPSSGEPATKRNGDRARGRRQR